MQKKYEKAFQKRTRNDKKKTQTVDKYLLWNKLHHQKDAGVGDHCHVIGK